MKQLLRNLGFRPLLCLILLLCVSTIGLARSYSGGIIYTRQGQAIKVVRFFEPLLKEDVITGKDGQDTVKIPISSVLELNLLTSDTNYMYQHSKFVPQTGIVTLVLRNGKTQMLTEASFRMEVLTYSVLGTNNKQQEQKIKFRDVVKIRFDASSGEVRACPLDKAVFPDDYLFCPFHGVPLVWFQP